LEADRGFENHIRHRRSRDLLAEFIYGDFLGFREALRQPMVSIRSGNCSQIRGERRQTSRQSGIRSAGRLRSSAQGSPQSAPSRSGFHKKLSGSEVLVTPEESRLRFV